LKCGIEKHVLKHGYLTLSYERNFKSDIRNLEFGFRYDFSFAQSAFTSRIINNDLMLTQSVKGSLMYDRKTSYLHAGNRTTVGKGGVVIIPFLDLDCDGVKDADEPKVLGLNVLISGGRVELSKKDSSIRIFDLEPYASYLLEFDRNGFDNISWQLKVNSMKVMVDPNQFRLIEVPVAVYGEVAGMINIQNGNSLKGLGRIIINFYNSAGKLAGKTLSESDGYFNFLGLPAGKYRAMVDTTQLRRINMKATPTYLEFMLERSIDGDVRDDLEFVLRSVKISKDTPGEGQGNTVEDLNRIETPKQDINEKKSGIETVDVLENKLHEKKIQTGKTPGGLDSGSYAIQVGAFSKQENARKSRDRLIDALPGEVQVIQDKQLYKVLVTGFKDRNSALKFLPTVKSRGFESAYIIQIK
jgi:hypothetical protein